MTCTDINTLTRQKELLLQKLSTFEETNRTLRDLLREQHCKEVSCWPCPTEGLWTQLQPSSTECPSSLSLSLFYKKKILWVPDLRGLEKDDEIIHLGTW